MQMVLRWHRASLIGSSGVFNSRQAWLLYRDDAGTSTCGLLKRHQKGCRRSHQHSSSQLTAVSTGHSNPRRAPKSVYETVTQS
jgi:hypothetical protein